MILIGLGGNLRGNLPGKGDVSPLETLEAALVLLEQKGLSVLQTSPWYASEPIPKSDQPWFVNGVAAIKSELRPHQILETLLELEKTLGRQRFEKNEARVIDLDLLDCRGEVLAEIGGLNLPHPRMHGRLFVLKPLQDIAPGWKHPVSGENVAQLIAKIGNSQTLKPL